MIRFLNAETVAGHRYGAGSIAQFDAPTEAALIAQADAENYPAVRPIEALASSAIAVSCASTAADEVLASFSIAAGVMGPNSILQIEPLWTYTNSANNKIVKVKVGGSTIYTATRTTTVKEGPLIVLANRNSLASQIQPYDNTYITAGSGAPATYTIDFSAAVDVEITGQRANGADTLKLEYFRALHVVGD